MHGSERTREAALASRTPDDGIVVRGRGLLTGWGTGLQSLPTQAAVTMPAQQVLAVATPVYASERLRRATRECLLGVAAVEAALDDGHLSPQEVAGPRTALVYASASSYAAANWTFLTSGAEQALHFPYTAPSAVPAEVSIQFGITGPYLTLLSGANAGIEALWQATILLSTAQCDRVLILGVETFQECTELYTAGRWLLGTPLLEAAACLILEGHAGLAATRYRAASGPAALERLVVEEAACPVAGVYLCTPTARAGHVAEHSLRAHWPHLSLTVMHERLGHCLACAPLIALMLAVAAGQPDDILCISQWWDAWAMLRWPVRGLQARPCSK